MTTAKEELDNFTIHTLQCVIKELEWMARLLHANLPSVEGTIALVQANIKLIEERQ